MEGILLRRKEILLQRVPNSFVPDCFIQHSATCLSRRRQKNPNGTYRTNSYFFSRQWRRKHRAASLCWPVACMSIFPLSRGLQIDIFFQSRSIASRYTNVHCPIHWYSSYTNLRDSRKRHKWRGTSHGLGPSILFGQRPSRATKSS